MKPFADSRGDPQTPNRQMAPMMPMIGGYGGDPGT